MKTSDIKIIKDRATFSSNRDKIKLLRYVEYCVKKFQETKDESFKKLADDFMEFAEGENYELHFEQEKRKYLKTEIQ